MVVECLPGSGFVATYTLMPDVQDRVLSKLKGQIVVTEDAQTKQNSTSLVRDFHQQIKWVALKRAEYDFDSLNEPFGSYDS